MTHPRSYFFPMLLIAIGTLWLLVAFGVIPGTSLWALTRIWPALLIGLGVSLILRNYWEDAGWLVSALLFLVIIATVLYAPVLGWTTPPAWGWHVNGGIIGAIGGSGVIVTDERPASGFEAVSVRYPAEITIIQGISPGVSITADDNLVPQLVTEVRSGTLVIDSKERDWSQRVNASETVRIEITVVDLNELVFDSAGTVNIDSLTTDSLNVRLNGAGSMHLNGLQVDDLTIRLDGAGSLELSGTVTTLDVDLNGLGSLEAGDLAATSAKVRVDGLGSATVRASDTLDISINGLGSVNYFGSPRVTEDKDGLGSIKKVGN